MHSVPEKWIDENHEKQKNMRNPTYHERAKNTMNMSHGTLVVFRFSSFSHSFSSSAHFHFFICCVVASFVLSSLCCLSLSPLFRQQTRHVGVTTITTTPSRRQHDNNNTSRCVCVRVQITGSRVCLQNVRVLETRGRLASTHGTRTTPPPHPSTHPPTLMSAVGCRRTYVQAFTCVGTSQYNKILGT